MTEDEMREQEGEDTEQDLDMNEGAEDVVGGRPKSDPDAAARERL
jgi:hypothetical protein